MIRSLRTPCLCAALLAFAAAGRLAPVPALAATHQDPKALAVVETLEKAIAPDNGWSKVGGLRFTFSIVKNGEAVPETHHSWNVWSGQYRVDWKTKEGDQRLALFNVGAKGKQGQAYIRLNRPSTGPADGSTEDQAAQEKKPRPDTAEWMRTPPVIERQTLEAGYGHFINDTYWLLMPLKMKDPGVNLDYDGEKKIDKQTYDVVKLTFDNVGLTPGDTYWVYVNRETHLIDRCEYILQSDAAKKNERSGESPEGGSSKPEATASPERTLWIWKDWQSFGPVKLATRKTMADGSTTVVLKNIEVLASMTDSDFQPPRTRISPVQTKADAK